MVLAHIMEEYWYLNNECAKESTGHGSPLPMLVHGVRAVQVAGKKWAAFVA